MPSLDLEWPPIFAIQNHYQECPLNNKAQLHEVDAIGRAYCGKVNYSDGAQG